MDQMTFLPLYWVMENKNPSLLFIRIIILMTSQLTAVPMPSLWMADCRLQQSIDFSTDAIFIDCSTDATSIHCNTNALSMD